MTHDEFITQYDVIARHALAFSEKSRREGILALEEILDQKKIDDRDIFEYGIRFVVDGIDSEIIEKILANIIRQEKDKNMSILKNIQKEAVLGIQKALNPRILYALLNSYADITIKEDEISKLVDCKH
jgi:flagellar motor component MotA